MQLNAPVCCTSFPVPSHKDKLCCFSGCSVYNTSRGMSFLQTSGPTVLWECGMLSVMCLSCWAALLWGKGGREESELISDMPQLEHSNPEKTLPTCKKSSKSGAVCKLILLFPLGNCQYIQFRLMPIDHCHPWEKKARSLFHFFPLARQDIGLVLFLQAACADCRCKLAYSPLAEDFRAG